MADDDRPNDVPRIGGEEEETNPFRHRLSVEVDTQAQTFRIHVMPKDPMVMGGMLELIRHAFWERSAQEQIKEAMKKPQIVRPGMPMPSDIIGKKPS